jgi:hypothetical protein
MFFLKKIIKNLVEKEIKKLTLSQIEIASEKKITLTDEIIYSILSKPEEWTYQDKYRIENKSKDIQIWIVNGLEHLKINDDEFLLNSSEKVKLWEAVTQHKQALLLKALKKNDNDDNVQMIVATNKLLVNKVKELENKLEEYQSKKFKYIGKD